MGQAFRRATGRIKATPASDVAPPSKPKRVVDARPPAASTDSSDGSDVAPKANTDNVLEERDPQYDVMLSQMAGRIRSKPGGKLEMGEAYVVEKYNRPMPKLRNTKPDSGRYEERPVPEGTLNVAQVRQIILLHQGKADDHSGPMDVQRIAEKFRVDVSQVQKILQFVSLPTGRQQQSECQ
ncbi:uncharacterized protein LOC115751808 [Rhodamnia argentea]|uniref:Uncharacterized protein LOC115751808 n=1 Tax=Rhodamnia argentea TaxID=178133 RepID=A0A8B8QEY6_9MYRT|nr:uncharacterized protein LOC115751808 [Rhodamnia argentea]